MGYRRNRLELPVFVAASFFRLTTIHHFEKIYAPGAIPEVANLAAIPISGSLGRGDVGAPFSTSLRLVALTPVRFCFQVDFLAPPP